MKKTVVTVLTYLIIAFIVSSCDNNKTAKQQFDDSVERTEESWEVLKDDAADIWDRTQNAAEELWDDTKETGKDVWDKTKKETEKANKKVKKEINDAT